MKKILILGGGVSSLEIVNEARELGYYTLVTDDRKSGRAKDLADEAYQISTRDIDQLARLADRHQVHGVFTGPSEFNIRNCIDLAQASGIPFYCSKAQWDQCSDKASFKAMCQEFGLPVLASYDFDGEIEKADLSHLRYPVMVKPVDAASSTGIFVCQDAGSVRTAYRQAQKLSHSGAALIEHYVARPDFGFTAYYIVIDGRVHLSLTGEKYVVDHENQLHITAAALFPSKYTEDYQLTLDPAVRCMIASLGMRNGVCFLQALVEDGQIYFHEMGLRLSGGLVSKFTQEYQGVNSMAMMVRNAVGDEMCSKEEEARISPDLGGHLLGSFCIPLKTGRLGRVKGLEALEKQVPFMDLMQNYQPGDDMPAERLGTLMQLFGRIKFEAGTRADAADFIRWVQAHIRIEDDKGGDMIYKYFDVNRLEGES